MICENCFLSSEQLAVVDPGIGAWQYWCKDCRLYALQLWSEIREEARVPAAQTMADKEMERYR